MNSSRSEHPRPMVYVCWIFFMWMFDRIELKAETHSALQQSQVESIKRDYLRSILNLYHEKFFPYMLSGLVLGRDRLETFYLVPSIVYIL